MVDAGDLLEVLGKGREEGADVRVRGDDGQGEEVPAGLEKEAG